jgi:opacity protein-like surface antigen
MAHIIQEQNMRNLLLISLLCVLCTLSAMSQDTPRVEVFGGYSLLHDGNASPTNFQGWNASSTAYVNRWFGITADFSGHYSTTNNSFLVSPGVPAEARFTQRIHTFMFGPHLAYRKSRYVPFGQALFGVNHTGADISVRCSSCGSAFGVGPPSTNTFSMALGGGMDIAVGHGFSVRPLQAEYILRRISSFNDNQFRYSTGVVFRLGSIRTQR